MVFIITSAIWASSYRLSGNKIEQMKWGWKIVPLTLFGWVWLGFGMTYIIRFLLLAYDPELLRTTAYPMWQMTGERLTEIWLFICVFWVMFCLGYLITDKILTNKKIPFFVKLNLLDSTAALPILNFFSIISLILTILIYGFSSVVPRIILTPLGHLTQLCFIALTLVWFWHFSGVETGRKQYLYMIPVIALYFLSPYREHILKLVACIFLPLIVTRENIRLRHIFAFGITIVLFLTILNQFYRSYLWEGMTLQESVKSISISEWLDRPQDTPWVGASKRFHGFDSTALSIHFVPELTPFDDRNIVLELIKTIIPRFIYSDKSDVQRGRLFSSEIWSYDEHDRIVDRIWAMIAPSMIGDLWQAGGLLSIFLGALIFGFVVAFLENCRKALRMGPSLAFISVYALLIAGAVERDFTNGVGVIIQTSLVLFLVVIALPIKREIRVES